MSSSSDTSPSDPSDQRSPEGPVVATFPLGMHWPTIDPFLFVAHHRDHYPSGGDDLGPTVSLEGRDLGSDFSVRDGWSMYHGRTVPGFPQHPHRGFETITHVVAGHIDHADSLGATARFGAGDTQWMTAGSGVVHAEMFPLLDSGADNPLELFQIWLNLPAADKMVAPYFTMLWRERTARYRRADDAGEVALTVVAGPVELDGRRYEPSPPPPDSWAGRPENEVAVWQVRCSGTAAIELPPASAGTGRVVYVHSGSGVELSTVDDGRVGEPVRIGSGTGARVLADRTLRIGGDGTGAACLILQGRPIGEPVAQYGPFVMNDRDGIVAAFDDYQRTGFGGWPWPVDDPVHDRTRGRFARHADGRVEDMEAAASTSS